MKNIWQRQQIPATLTGPTSVGSVSSPTVLSFPLFKGRDQQARKRVEPGWLRSAVIAAALVILGCKYHAASEYGLPVPLGSSSTDVRRVLGSPKESFKSPNDERLMIEWYYNRGIVGVFERDQLNEIVLHNGALVDYPGFLAYTDEIVRGLRLTDNKQKILDVLGKPTKLEANDLQAGTDPNAAVVWPQESRYYWRMTAWTVEVDFLNQAEVVSEERHLILPRDAVTMISVKR